VPESSYFDWNATGRASQAGRDAADEKLVVKIRDAHEASDGTYGCPRVHDELRDGGTVVSKRRVARLMKIRGIQGLSGRERSATTTMQGSKPSKIPDLVNRGFRPAMPDQVWYGDITYIWVENQFWYLATVIDACTKQVLGWAFDDHMETGLVEIALKNAVARRGTNVAGVIFHSDRGSQYTSKDFAATCRLFGITQSVGRTGVCYDNAAAESFFATIKRELIDRYHFDTAAQLNTQIFAWVETWYNQRRKHTTLNMATPNQTHKQLTNQTKTQKKKYKTI